MGICVVRLTTNLEIKYDTSLAYNIYTLLCAVNIIKMELTDRELAVRWWNRKSTIEKVEELKKAGLKREDVNKLSESEMEWIWRNQQSL